MSAQNNSQSAPSVDEVFGFLQGLVGSVVQGVGEITGADRQGNVSTADGENYRTQPAQQDGETVVIFEQAPKDNTTLYVAGGVALAAVLLLR